MPYHTLGQIRQQYQSLTNDLLSKYPGLKQRQYRRGDIILSQGEVQLTGYYLVSGLLVSSAINEEGRLRHKEFYFPDELCILFAEWLRKSPSFYQITALEYADVIEVPLSLLDKPIWQTLKLRLVEQQLLFKEAKEAFLVLNTLEQRYRFMIDYRPNWLEHISNQDLANYLVSTPQALSRLKNRIN